MTTSRDIPVAHTPPGGYGDEMPPPILAGCTEPLVDGAPDLRGTWRTVDASGPDGPLPPESPMWGHVERIEQAGDRVVVTSGGLVHDMRCDGTYEHGINDLASTEDDTTLTVAASFEDEMLVLRPRGMPGVEVMRWREGDQLLWSYHALFTTRLERVEDDEAPGPEAEPQPDVEPEPEAEPETEDAESPDDAAATDEDAPPLIRPGSWTRRADGH